MNNIIFTQNKELTMSSSQLSDMLGYQKKEINRKIKAMFQDKIAGGIISPTLRDNGQVSDYHLPELESKMFVAKHDIKYLEKITQYWIDKNKPVALPSPTQLALMVIKSEAEKAAALIEVDRLQGVCQTITAQFAKGVTAPKFCKQLQGVNTQQVNNSLIDLGMLSRRKDGVVPTAYSRDRYFAEKQEMYNGKLRSHSALTLTGAKWLYRAYLSNKLPMKSNWNGSFVHVVFEEK